MSIIENILTPLVPGLVGLVIASPAVIAFASAANGLVEWFHEFRERRAQRQMRAVERRWKTVEAAEAIARAQAISEFCYPAEAPESTPSTPAIDSDPAPGAELGAATLPPAVRSVERLAALMREVPSVPCDCPKCRQRRETLPGIDYRWLRPGGKA